METIFESAQPKDLPHIMEIIEFAIASRKADGSDQWQDGYPNRHTIATDLQKNQAFVLKNLSGEILAYAAVIEEVEPAYEVLRTWLNREPYITIHRVAVAKGNTGQGIATKVFEAIHIHALENGYRNIKVDTNYDNIPMLKILQKLGYHYCGEVFFRGSARKAFQKILD